jgi:hypothetical protein
VEVFSGFEAVASASGSALKRDVEFIPANTVCTIENKCLKPSRRASHSLRTHHCSASAWPESEHTQNARGHPAQQWRSVCCKWPFPANRRVPTAGVGGHRHPCRTPRLAGRAAAVGTRIHACANYDSFHAASVLVRRRSDAWRTRRWRTDRGGGDLSATGICCG